MEPLIIEGTGTTPRVVFNTDGSLLLQGRSIAEDSFKFFDPLFDWVSNFTGASVIFNIRLDYLNTSSSKQLLNLLLKIKENHKVSNISVKWFFEEGDDDHKELGLHLEQITKIAFTYSELTE